MTKIIILIYVIAAIASFIGKQQKKKRLKEAAQNKKGAASTHKGQSPLDQLFRSINPDEAKMQARTSRVDPMAEPEPIKAETKYPEKNPPPNKPRSFSGNILGQLAEEFGFQFDDKELKKFSDPNINEKESHQKSGKLSNWNPEEEYDANWEEEEQLQLENEIEKTGKAAYPSKVDPVSISDRKTPKNLVKIAETRPYDRSSTHKYALLLKKKNGLKSAIVTKTILDKPLGW